MCRTRHLQKTLSQDELHHRLSGVLSSLISQESLERGCLSQEECKKILKDLKKIQNTVRRIAKSGGCVVVSVEDRDITAYRVNSFMQHR